MSPGELEPSIASDEDPVLASPKDFAHLQLGRRHCGTLSPAARSEAPGKCQEAARRSRSARECSVSAWVQAQHCQSCRCHATRDQGSAILCARPARSRLWRQQQWWLSQGQDWEIL